MTDGREQQIQTSGRRALSARHPIVPIALSFCSGFVDVVCYLGLFHAFTAFITGTVIILCSELFREDSLVWVRLVILMTFVVSAVIWVHVVKWLIRSERAAVSICLGLECLFLALFTVSALALPISSQFLSIGTTLALVFATIAMALQNVAMQLALNFHIPTTVMTGNLMRFVVAAIERVGGNAGAQRGDGTRSAAGEAHYGRSLVAFVGGCVLGAACLATIGFWGLLLPVGLIGGLAIVTRD